MSKCKLAVEIWKDVHTYIYLLILMFTSLFHLFAVEMFRDCNVPLMSIFVVFNYFLLYFSSAPQRSNRAKWKLMWLVIESITIKGFQKNVMHRRWCFPVVFVNFSWIIFRWSIYKLMKTFVFSPRNRTWVLSAVALTFDHLWICMQNCLTKQSKTNWNCVEILGFLLRQELLRGLLSFLLWGAENESWSCITYLFLTIDRKWQLINFEKPNSSNVIMDELLIFTVQIPRLRLTVDTNLHQHRDVKK